MDGAASGVEEFHSVASSDHGPSVPDVSFNIADSTDRSIDSTDAGSSDVLGVSSLTAVDSKTPRSRHIFR